jgi:hypothetical protein
MMRQIKSILAFIFLWGILTVCISCKEDPEPLPISPLILEGQIIKSTYPADQGTVHYKDSVIVFFNEPFGKEKIVDKRTYRAIIDEVSVVGVTTILVKAKDSLSIALFPVDLLDDNTSFQISVKAHWEVFDETWQVVINEGAEVRESALFTFNNSPPPVINSKILKSSYPVSQATIATEDSVVVFFNEPFGKTKVVENHQYRAIIDEVSLVGVPCTRVKANDSLSITLSPIDFLKGSSSFQILVKAHWEIKHNGVWKTVVWENSELRENSTITFNTAPDQLLIDNDNIAYQYPIPNQYHFLTDEYPFCFIKLIHGQESIMTLDGYSYAAIFTDFSGAKVESAITYDKNARLIKFAVPATLLKETIYSLKIVTRSPSAAETTLNSYHFRTSKYSNFVAKFNDFTFGFAGDYLVDNNPYDQPIFNWITGAGEYFDSFENINNTTSVTYQGKTYSIPYSGSGLVRVTGDLSTTDWYKNKIYPLVYAPLTDPTFKITMARDTSLFSYPPVEVVYFDRFGSGTLTPEIVASNNAPPIAQGTRPEIIWRNEFFMYRDFISLQSQVVAKYINNPSPPERETKIMQGVFPRISAGKYSYQVKYVIPSGQITSTITKSITY